MAAAGIDLGNTSIIIATCKDGRPEIVTTDTGEWVTPAIVSFLDQEQMIGTSAKLGLIRNAVNCVNTVKSVIGKSFTDDTFKKVTKRSPSKMVRKDGKVYYEITKNGRQTLVAASDVAVLFYKNILKNIQTYSGCDDTEVVLAVPLHFEEKQRSELRKAAEKAGFSVLRTIHEPSAAALAYGIGQDDVASTSLVMVYHLGGSSLEVTLISVNSGIYRIIDSIYDDSIGGNQFDDVLVNHLASEFKRQWKQDITENKRAMAKLYAAAESGKHVLTSHATANCSVESLYEGIDFQCNVSRAKFELLSSKLAQNCLDTVDQLLGKCKINASDVDKIVLSGGSTRLPKLQILLQEKFKNKTILKQISPECVVAYGAAIQASLLQGKDAKELAKSCQRIKCTTKSIAVKMNEDTFITVIPRFTPIPVKRIHKFNSLKAEQNNVCLDIYELSEDESCAFNQHLAKVILDGLPPLSQDECRISASFHVKMDGSLHIHVSEKTSNKSVGVTVEHS